MPESISIPLHLPNSRWLSSVHTLLSVTLDFFSRWQLLFSIRVQLLLMLKHINHNLITSLVHHQSPYLDDFLLSVVQLSWLSSRSDNSGRLSRWRWWLRGVPLPGLFLPISFAFPAPARRSGRHQSGRWTGNLETIAADVPGPVAGLELVAVHQPSGAGFEQGAAEHAYVVLGAVSGVGVVAEFFGAVEIYAGFYVSAHLDISADFSLCLANI